MKTKSIEKLEAKMTNIAQDTVRYHVLENAKFFKTSWMELGQALYSVWKDKLYKNWGYTQFDAYVAKEIGIRKQTAMKLLKSYHFLEKEEPNYLKRDYVAKSEAASLPTFESIDTLRLANSKGIDREDYENIKTYVLKKGKDAREVKKDLTALVKQRKELDDPETARNKRKSSILKRFVSTLKSMANEMKALKMLESQTLQEIGGLIIKLEKEIK